MTRIDRRAALALMMAATACARRPADGAKGRAVTFTAKRRPLFTRGPLAHNRVAAEFERPPAGLQVPDVALASPTGLRRLSELTGEARIVSVWAEWCGPCLAEAHDLASLRARKGGRDFDVLAVLSASVAKLDVAGAQAKLASVRAAGLPTWVEPGGGERVALSLAADPRGGTPFSVPCNLLVDRHGRVRARAFGVVALDPGAVSRYLVNGRLTAEGEARMPELMSRTLWSTPDADAFADALAAGALDQLSV